MLSSLRTVAWSPEKGGGSIIIRFVLRFTEDRYHHLLLFKHVSVPNISLIFFLIISQSLRFSSHSKGFSSPHPPSQEGIWVQKEAFIS